MAGAPTLQAIVDRFGSDGVSATLLDLRILGPRGNEAGCGSGSQALPPVLRPLTSRPEAGGRDQSLQVGERSGRSASWPTDRAPG